MSSAGECDIPGTGAVFTFGKSSFAENLPNKFWVKNDRVLQIHCGDEHTALVAETGRVFMFGANTWGQLGLGHHNTANKPYCIKSLKHEKVRLIACGRSHTFAATESGLLYSFGSNGDGQLGIEDMNDTNVPKCIGSLDAMFFKMLGAGVEHSLALTEDGRVFGWGGNGEGQLGLADDDGCPAPKELEFDENVIFISCGYYHTGVVTESGQLFMFGENDMGKLGVGHAHEVKTPELVSSIPERVKAVSCGGSHTAVLTENGKVYTFGDGGNGQLGLGNMMMQASTPQLIKFGPKVSQIFCGENFTAFITERGQLFTCGDGRHGKLAQGVESFTNLLRPTLCEHFVKFHVENVACGGCHMIVTACPKQQNGHIEDEEEFEEEEKMELEHTLRAENTLDLSISARVRRRNTFNEHSVHLNRTLPSLGPKRTVPTDNSTLQIANSTVQGQESETFVPNLDLKPSNGRKAKYKDIEESDEEESDEDEDKPKPMPQPRVKPVAKGLDSAGEDTEKSAEESPDETEHLQSEVRQLSTPKAAPRKVVKSESEESLQQDEEDGSRKKDKTKDKKSKGPKKPRTNIFGKKNILDDKSDDEEEDEDDDDSVAGDNVKQKQEKNREAELQKEKEKEEDEEKKEAREDGDKKDKTKAKKGKDKKKGKKEEEEEDEEKVEVESEEEHETKKKKKKDKVKKKTKGKKKQEEEEVKSEKEDEEKDKKDNENEVEDKEKETPPPPPPKKKSRFCTIL